MSTKITKEIVKFCDIRGVQVTSDSSPSSFPPHFHSAAEFTVALEDGCHYRVFDEDIILDKGDILLVWPRQPHETVNVPKYGSVFIQFAPGLVETNLDIISSAGFLYDYHKLDAKKNPEIAKYVAQKILEIRGYFENREYFSESKAKLCICEILLAVCEFALSEHQEQLEADFYSDPGKKHIYDALGYIDEHAAENITQADVAAFVGLSPYHFSRLFKKHVNKSFPSYLAEVRARNATRLLSDGSLSITECAFHSGFQSITAFNKVFRDVIGCTPREYRKSQYMR